jgi:hypothetical protein
VSTEFEAFKSELLDRHTNPLTSRLATAGDVVWLASVPVGLATRSVRIFVVVFAAGTVVITGAHLFQPGTLKTEVAAVLRHPVWAARAEYGRVLGR